MKEILLAGLIVAVSSATASAALAASGPVAPTRAAPVAAIKAPLDRVGTHLRPITCGFICDSTGRCYRTCW
jgi:hypothetical protein